MYIVPVRLGSNIGDLSIYVDDVVLESEKE